MQEEFRKFVNDNSLFGKNERILLAVSGGIDSMVMANLFLSLENFTGIAHCNFNLRGKESDMDENLVRDFGHEHHIGVHTVRFDTSGYAAEKGISVQMAARELRYSWFEEIRDKYSYDLIALAHNLNDNVETFLINLTRGTGIAGLTGMKPLNNRLVRPLLFATRRAIEEYSLRNGISYREDASNSDTKYLRNRFRHEIIPIFREINPSFDEAIRETSRTLSEINDIKTIWLDNIRSTILLNEGETTVFDAVKLADESFSPTMIYELFRPYGLGRAQVEDLKRIIGGRTGSRIITASHRIFKNRGEIVIDRIWENDTFIQLINSPEEYDAVEKILSFELLEVGTDFSIPKSGRIACLDADKIKFPLTLRRWASGDSFYPLGMNGKKKLSDYFTDKKYSAPEKERCLILESDGKIVWLIGDRIDNRFRISPSTTKALIISYKGK